MSAHTPGPWRPSWGKIVDSHEKSVCMLTPRKGAENANLIAAAPDLLAVLSSMVSDYAALQRSQGASANIGAIGSEFTAGQWVGSRIGGHIAKAQQLIAKAQGETL